VAATEVEDTDARQRTKLVERGTDPGLVVKVVVVVKTE
jgi:hypothetical protein